jgi:outer membrane protein assembly factor BamB
MHNLFIRTLTSALLIAAVVPCALAASGTATETVSAAAAAFGAVWDEMAAQLPIRAKAFGAPAPAVTDITLARAMAGSDLRMQLVVWSNAHIAGRAWIEGIDEVPCPVYVMSEHPGQSVSLSVAVGMPEDSAKPGKSSLCSYDLVLTDTAGRISGRFDTPGLDVEPLPIVAAKGTLQGARIPLPAPLPRPKFRAGVPAGGELADARKTLSATTASLRLWRTIDIALTHAVSASNAWWNSRYVPPEPADAAAAHAALMESAKAVTVTSVDDLFDKELSSDEPGAAAKSKRAQASGSASDDPAAKTRAAVVRGFAARMQESAILWARSLATSRIGAPGWEEAGIDPDFGPWYGADCLATNKTQANALPENAGAGSGQNWAFVRNWLFAGPFPPGHTNVFCWNIPEFFDFTNAVYRTDIKAIRDLGETFAPDSPVVTWKHGFPDGTFVGAQRPPIWRGVTNESEITENLDPFRYSGTLRGHFYARTEVHSSKDVELWIAIGADDHGRLWVNDRLAATTNPEDSPPERTAWGKATFRKGINSLVVRCDSACRGNPLNKFRRGDPWEAQNYFWVRIAVQGKPLDAAASAARQAALAMRMRELRDYRPRATGLRNDHVANYPDARPVTAWDLDTGMNVVWMRHLELDAPGGYNGAAYSSKAPPTVMRDPAGKIPDRLILFREPHFVLCLDKATGKTIWERECNVLELTAPDQLAESRRLWAEYEQALKEAMDLGRTYEIRTTNLVKKGMSEKEAWDENKRVCRDAVKKGWTDRSKPGKKGSFYGHFTTHAKFGNPCYGPWTAFTFAPALTDGERIWVKIATGVAACYDRDGNRLWMSRIPAEGSASCMPSPLLLGDKFIIDVGAKLERPDLARGDPNLTILFNRHWWEASRLIGLDANTGKEVWRTEAFPGVSLSTSPVGVRLTNGKEEMDAVVTTGGVLVRAEDGKILSRTWFTDAGQGTPTVPSPVASEIYHSDEDCVLRVNRPVMYDRDTAGLRRIWTAFPKATFDGGFAYADGLLYGSGGGQGAYGYVVFDTLRRTMLRYEPPYAGYVWRGVPPQVNGRQYVPIVVAGDYVFIGENGSVFHGRVAQRGAVYCVMQKKWDGFLVAQSFMDRQCTAPPVFDGDLCFIRSDSVLACIGRTGKEGMAYEADVNARYMLGDMEAQPPEDSPAIEIEPKKPLNPRVHYTPFTGFLTHPMDFVGHFDIARADDVLASMGGPAAVEPEDLSTNEYEVAGLTLRRTHVDNCGMYGAGFEARAMNTYFHDTAFGKGAYFMAALVNDRDRVVRLWAPQEPPDVWICGRKVAEGTRLKLKPGIYHLLARAYHTEEWPAAQGFYFRFEDSSDVKAERERWQNLLKASRPELERILKYSKHNPYKERAAKLLAAIEKNQ